jgi:hypothetical protein
LVPNFVRALRDYEPLCEPVLWFTARDASQGYDTTPQPFLRYKSSGPKRIGVTVLVAVGKIPWAVHGASTPFIDVRPVSSLSPLFSVPQRSVCDTILNSSDVLAVLKHDL